MEVAVITFLEGLNEDVSALYSTLGENSVLAVKNSFEIKLSFSSVFSPFPPLLDFSSVAVGILGSDYIQPGKGHSP